MYRRIAWAAGIAFLFSVVGCILPGIFSSSNIGPLVGSCYAAPFGFGLGYFIGDIIEGRVRKRLQGHCPKCQYELKGALDAGCPECGWGRNGHNKPMMSRDVDADSSAP